jgi:hypothetical protein
LTEIFYRQVKAVVGSRAGLLTAIEHEGEVLIVLTMLANPALKVQKPEYVLPLTEVGHQAIDDPTAGYRWLVTERLPKALFDGTATRQQRRRLGVRMGPDVTFPLGARE